MKTVKYFHLCVLIVMTIFFNLQNVPIHAYRRNGIDVSTWNKKIDWKSVKKAGINFAMIRTSFGWSDRTRFTDAQLRNNIKGAKAVGINIGAYHYSYATNTKEATWEADFFISCLKGTKWEYPVCLDIEDPIQERLSNRQRTDIAITFLNRVKKAGYYTGFYTNLDWALNKLDMNKLNKHILWMAHWNDKCGYTKNYGIWQYSNVGRIPGIITNVDLNYSYKDFPAIIKKAHLNGF